MRRVSWTRSAVAVATAALTLGVGACSDADDAAAALADDEAAVRAVAQAYLDGLLHGDVAVLEGAFHPETRFQGSVGDAFVDMTFREWAESRRGKEMRPVDDHRHSIEDVLISGDAAVVRTDIDWPDTYFVDYLSLLRIGGEWTIVNKIWTERPSPRAMEGVEDRPLPAGSSAFAGTFRSEGEDGLEMSVDEAGSRLVLGIGERRYELYHQGDDAFAPEFDVDDRVRFERDEDGRVDRLHLVLGDTTIVAERVTRAP